MSIESKKNKKRKYVFLFLLSLIFYGIINKCNLFAKGNEYGLTKGVSGLLILNYWSLHVESSSKIMKIKWDILILLPLAFCSLLLDIHYRAFPFVVYILITLYIAEALLLICRFNIYSRSHRFIYQYAFKRGDDFLFYLFRRLKSVVYKD
jgi:hypothetical protein